MALLENESKGLADKDNRLTAVLRSHVYAALSGERYAHSLRTAQTAELLCRRYAVNEKDGYFAGLAHDMCKDMDEETIFKLASADGLSVSDLERKKKSLLHGRAAAVVLAKNFGISNTDILQAVCFHTFGMAGMCSLAKIVYIADKIEPARPHSSFSYVKSCMSLSLDTLLLSVVKENVRYLEKQKKTLAPETFDLIQSLKGEKNVEL